MSASAGAFPPNEIAPPARNSDIDRDWIRLDEVERRPVRLREARDHEDQEADELRDEIPHALLRLDDAGERHRLRDHDHADERHALRDLVGDQLRGGAHATEQRVLVGAAPA